MNSMTKGELYKEAQDKLYQSIADDLRKYPSMIYLQIAVKYGVGHTTVCDVAKLFGILRRRGRKPKAPTTGKE
jgi:hypothetical protein